MAIGYFAIIEVVILVIFLSIIKLGSFDDGSNYLKTF
jgi:hypothetical protein